MKDIQGWFDNLIRDYGYAAIAGILIFIVLLLIVLRKLFARHDEIR
jgi:hypothetical protein